jgi:hypothetical protein
MTRGKFSGCDTSGVRGVRVSWCPLCHEAFSGESTFVLHRIEGSRVSAYPGRYIAGECRHPESKGMTLGANGVWKLPLSSDSALKQLNRTQR